MLEATSLDLRELQELLDDQTGVKIGASKRTWKIWMICGMKATEEIGAKRYKMRL
jgi:hypothetical protein